MKVIWDMLLILLKQFKVTYKRSTKHDSSIGNSCRLTTYFVMKFGQINTQRFSKWLRQLRQFTINAG